MTTQNMIGRAYSTTPTALTLASWDTNANLSAVGFIPGYTTTATAGGTTTLTVASNQQQYFTGSTNQTLVMPVANTLVIGQYWSVVNNSTGVITIQSSGSNTILALPANSETIVTCILNSGTTAASWMTSPAVSGSGTVNSGTAGQLAYYAASGNAVSGGQLGNVKGTATNDNAAAGNVGEFVTNSGSGVSLSTDTAANITSMSLTAGDWDVNGFISFVTGGTVSRFFYSISTTSATEGTNSGRISLGTGLFSNSILSAPYTRLSLSTTTTVYLVGLATFLSSTVTCSGTISARRMR